MPQETPGHPTFLREVLEDSNSDPLLREWHFLKRVVIGTKAEIISLKIKSNRRQQKIFNCSKEGHPASHCLEMNKKDIKKI